MPEDWVPPRFDDRGVDNVTQAIHPIAAQIQWTRKLRAQPGKIGLALLRPPFGRERISEAPFLRVKADVDVAVGPMITPDTAAEQIQLLYARPGSIHDASISARVSRPSP
jgi:hypothetical protein